jgi:hypothetical protein
MSEIAKHWIDGEWVGSETVSESVSPAAISEFTRSQDRRPRHSAVPGLSSAALT